MLKPTSLNERLRYLLEILFVAAFYFVLARVSLLLRFQESNASPVWAPSGFAFAVMLLRGYRIAPAIFLGAFVSNFVVFLSNQTSSFSLAGVLSLAIGIGNTAEAVTGTYLIRKLISGFSPDTFLTKVKHVFQLLSSAAVMCLTSSVIGVTTVYVAEIISANQYPTVWLTWWLGDVAGIIVITPLILIWAKAVRNPPLFLPADIKRKAEVVLLFITVFVVSGIIFDNWVPLFRFFEWAFWIIPVLVWAAIRFNQRETITALALCAGVAILGTVNGHGPFSKLPLNDALLTTIGFVSIIIITKMVLNISVLEQAQTEVALREAGKHLETRVKQRSHELAERNRFIETIFDSAEEMMAVFDRNCNFISLNRKTEKIYGFKRNDVIGRNVLDVVPVVRQTLMHDNLQRALKGETIHDLSYRSKLSNRYFEVFFTPLKNEAHEIYGVLVVAHDNTQLIEATKKLKQSEEIARLSEQKFRGLLENAPDAMVIMNQSGIIELVNSQTEILFGYDRRELIGKEAGVLIPGQFHSTQTGYQNSYLHNSRIRQPGTGLNLPGRRKNGAEFPVEVSLSPLETPEGVLVLASIRDVSERKQKEIELQQMTDEIILGNKELEKMNRELESFVYAAGHDLQEPLRKIASFTSRILEKEMDSLSDSAKDSFKRIQSGANRMKQLIDDLLAYSKASTSEKHFEKTDLNTVLEHVKAELHEKIAVTHTTIESEQLPELQIIPFQFQQLFTNLITNSIKFSKPGISPNIRIIGHFVDGSQIGAEGNPAKKYHRLSFSDNGIGFDAQYSERIFGLFQRLHGRSEYDGSGVGLSICKKIVENHRGVITASGEPGKGATFHIYVPAS